MVSPLLYRNGYCLFDDLAPKHPPNCRWLIHAGSLRCRLSRRKDVRASINGTSFGNRLRIRTDDLKRSMHERPKLREYRSYGTFRHLWFMVRKWRFAASDINSTTTSVLAVLGVRWPSIAMR